jgi:NADH:ubiquinone reductase (H+-translocating)
VTIPYDSLILAAGSGTSYFGHDEFQQYSLPMKSLDDALALRHQIYGAFELAEAETDEERRRAHMTFVVVGGGPTGVEMAGQLRELSRRALYRNYRSIDPALARVLLVEGSDRLIGSMGDRVSRLTLKYMKRLGVEVHLNAMVTDIGDGWVELSLHDKTTHRIQTATTIWAAGVKGSELASSLAKATGAELDKTGRVKVDSDCTVPGHPEIFVVGDLMALNDLPGLAEVAIQSGAHASFVIRRRLRGKTDKRDFKYRDLGTLAAISRFRAVAKIGPFSFGGFLGWLVWLVVHITFLTGFKNRFGALMRWTVSFVGRGRSERALTGHRPIS